MKIIQKTLKTTTDKGNATEAIIISRLAYWGYQIYLPLGHDTRADLVVDDLSEGPQRIQCKTGWVKDGAICFNAATGKGVKYTDCDMLIVYCPSTPDDLYQLHPKDENLPGKVSLRLTAPKNNQKKGVRWAKDYLIRPWVDQGKSIYWVPAGDGRYRNLTGRTFYRDGQYQFVEEGLPA